MENYLELIAARLSGYDQKGAQRFEETVAELCKNGIAKGCYQDYRVLCDVVEILSIIEKYLKEKK